MGNPRESTETIVRRHVAEHVETRVRPLEEKVKSHEEFHDEIRDATQEVKTLSMEQMQRMHEMTSTIKNVQQASNMNTDMLIGKMPPDENDPGIWRRVVDLDEWKETITKNWTAIKWTFITGIVTAIGTGVGALIWFALSGEKIE